MNDNFRQQQANDHMEQMDKIVDTACKVKENKVYSMKLKQK